MICPACGAAVPEAARFCPECGQRLVAAPDERRLVTVLMADLVGFTAYSESVDPEQVKRVVDVCFERLTVDVTTFGGRLDKIVGDELVALFGAPVAHEDDAERAVRAALRMQESLAAVATEIGVAVQMRVGINTGEVLVGAMRTGGDPTVMGDVVNTASRLESLAGPGEVIVGAATYAATRDTIAYEALGLLSIRGRDEPVEAYRAMRALAPPGRRRQRGRTALVGRDAEVGALRHMVKLVHTRAPLRSSCCCSETRASARAGSRNTSAISPPRSSAPAPWSGTASPTAMPTRSVRSPRSCVKCAASNCSQMRATHACESSKP